MQLLQIWKAADAQINAVLAMALSTLAFAAATFLTGWIKTKEQEVLQTVSDDTLNKEAKLKLSCAKQAVRGLLIAFVAFAFLLAQSIFVDPLADADTEWTKLTIFDSITASGGLGAGMIFFLKAAINVYRSAA